MKKAQGLALTALLLTSCGASGVNQEGANVFPSSTKEDSISVTMGDVMPFYDDGVMNIFHLRNTTGSNSLFYHPIARLSTKDYIHYTDKGIALNYEEEVTSIDAALGTGSFIKGNDGTYHCFYTGHNDKAHDSDMQGAKLLYNEAIRHATSKDGMETWAKDEDFMRFGDADDYRDPYVYYDSVDACYYMLITTRERGNAVIRRLKSTSLDAKGDEWQDVGNFFVNDEGFYNMECPSFVQLGDYYYLAYSEQGDNRVTHYRYKTSHDGEWKKFKRDAIDASGFYAGRLEKAGDKLYAFAWCARLTGGNTGSFDWAGNLVSHELIQKEDGELCAVMPSTYKDYFTHDIPYADASGKVASGYSFDGEGFHATALGKLSENVTRASMKVVVDDDSGDFGITFGLDNQYDNRLGDGILSFDLDENRLCCHNNVSSILRYGPELTGVSYEFEKGKEYGVDMIIDDEVVSLYLNGDVALTARLIDMEKHSFAFYSNNAKAEIKEVRFYE